MYDAFKTKISEIASDTIATFVYASCKKSGTVKLAIMKSDSGESY